MKADARALLPEYVLGTLPAVEAAEMDRLVEASPALRAEAAEIALALGSLAEALPPLEPPPALRRRVMSSLGARPRQAVATVAAAAGITLAGALVLAALNWPVADLVAQRIPGLALLMVAQLAAWWAILGGGRSRWAEVSWIAAAAGAAFVLTARGGGHADGPGWICSLSQLGAGLAPLTLALFTLRDGAWSWRRGITAGLALGSSSAIWGEIACARGVLHVAVHHGGPCLLLLSLVLLVGRALPRRALAWGA
jgi:hypothetical protein